MCIKRLYIEHTLQYTSCYIVIYQTVEEVWSLVRGGGGEAEREFADSDIDVGTMVLRYSFTRKKQLHISLLTVIVGMCV